MGFARGLAHVNAVLLLVLVYLLFVGPLSLAMKVAGRDPLDRAAHPGEESDWKEKEPILHTIESARRQF